MVGGIAQPLSQEPGCEPLSNPRRRTHAAFAVFFDAPLARGTSDEVEMARDAVFCAKKATLWLNEKLVLTGRRKVGTGSPQLATDLEGQG